VTVEFQLADFDELQDWLNSDPEVPEGKWYKRFPKFTLAGEGELPKTFLKPEMVPHGKEVRQPVRQRLNRSTSESFLG
jgi:hypothetical protein